MFGTTVSGRPPEIPGIESMVGLFINTVPVRLRPEHGETLAALLTRLQEEQGRLLGSQFVGLTDIRGVTALDELFDTLVVFENYPLDAEALRTAQQGCPVSPSPGSAARTRPTTRSLSPSLRATL
ncbi:condensation domain-containing protein [Streptomyces sp. M10(2022)]